MSLCADLYLISIKATKYQFGPTVAAKSKDTAVQLLSTEIDARQLVISRLALVDSKTTSNQSSR